MTSNRLAKHYSEKYSKDSDQAQPEIVRTTPFPTNRTEAAVHFIRTHFGTGSILELGAGSGVMLGSLLAAGVPFERYVASDISEPRLDRIRRTIRDPRVETRWIDAEVPIDRSIGTFDVIVMVALIEHLVDPIGTMKEVRQLLKPGAFVYLDTPNIAKYTRRAKLFAGKFPSTASMDEGLVTYAGTSVDLFDEGHLHYFTYRSLSIMLMKYCGFSGVKKLGYFHGKQYLGRRVCRALAMSWPELFSDIALIAYR